MPGRRQVVAGVRREEHHDVPVAAEDERRVVVVVAAQALEDHALGELAAGRVARDPHVAGRRDPAGERVRRRARSRAGRRSTTTPRLRARGPLPWPPSSGSSERASIALGHPRDHQRRRRSPGAPKRAASRPRARRRRGPAAPTRPRPPAMAIPSATGAPNGAPRAGRSAATARSRYRRSTPAATTRRPRARRRRPPPRRRLALTSRRARRRPPAAGRARPRTRARARRHLVAPGDQHAPGGRDRRLGDRHPAAGVDVLGRAERAAAGARRSCSPSAARSGTCWVL